VYRFSVAEQCEVESDDLIDTEFGPGNAAHEPGEAIVLFGDEHPQFTFPPVLHTFRRRQWIAVLSHVPDHVDMLFTLPGTREKADVPGETSDQRNAPPFVEVVHEKHMRQYVGCKASGDAGRLHLTVI